MTGGTEPFPVERASLTIPLAGGQELSISVDRGDAGWAVHGVMPETAAGIVEGRLPQGWTITTPRGKCYITYTPGSEDLFAVVTETREVLGALAELPPTGYWFDAKGDVVSIDHWPGSDTQPVRLSFARIEPTPLDDYQAADPSNPTTAFITAVCQSSMANQVEFADGEVLVTLTPDAAQNILSAMSKLVAIYVRSK